MNIRCVKMRRTGLVTTWVESLSRKSVARILDHDVESMTVLEVFSKLDEGHDVRLDRKLISKRDEEDAVVGYFLSPTSEKAPDKSQGYFWASGR